MWRRVRPWGIALAAGTAATAMLFALSQVILTLDALTNTQIRIAYIALVALIVLVAALVIRRQVMPTTRRMAQREPTSAAPAAEQRLARLYAEHGLDDDQRLPPHASQARGSGTGDAPPVTIMMVGFADVGRRSLVRALSEALDTGNTGAEWADIRGRLVVAPELVIGAPLEGATLDAVMRADLVLFVIDQDLRHHDFEALALLSRAARETWLILTKADLYNADQLAEVEAAIGLHLARASISGAPSVPMITVAADPLPALRAVGGGTEEQEVTFPPKIDGLLVRLKEFAERTGGAGSRLILEKSPATALPGKRG